MASSSRACAGKQSAERFCSRPSMPTRELQSLLETRHVAEGDGLVVLELRAVIDTAAVRNVAANGALGRLVRCAPAPRLHA